MSVLRKIKKALHRVEEVLMGAPRGFYDDPAPVPRMRKASSHTPPKPVVPRPAPAPQTARRDFSSSYDRRPARRNDDDDGDLDTGRAVDIGLDIVDAFRHSQSNTPYTAPAAQEAAPFTSGGGGNFGGGGASGDWSSDSSSSSDSGGSGGGGGGGGDMRLIATLHETASGRKTKRNRILELA